MLLMLPRQNPSGTSQGRPRALHNRHTNITMYLWQKCHVHEDGHTSPDITAQADFAREYSGAPSGSVEQMTMGEHMAVMSIMFVRPAVLLLLSGQALSEISQECPQGCVG